MKPVSPDTRESLILRLPTLSDAAAWEEFVAIYEPLVMRFASRRGLQDADACELVQNVLIAVAKSVPRWQPDRERGRFRAWLFRIARNQLINLLKQRSGHHLCDGAGDPELIKQISSDVQAQATMESEYRRELFRAAAAVVRPKFQDSTWRAFWLTSIEEQSVDIVANELKMSVSAVYVARSRVTHRLKETIQLWEANDEI